MRHPVAPLIAPPGRGAMRMFRVTVTATAPLTVKFPDGSTHRALGFTGSTFSTTSGSYVALHQSGGLPVVLSVS